MTEKPGELDLELWLDRETIPRQNMLKAKFWDILAEVGNSIDSDKLIKIHPSSRGVKLSKGNDLLGYPYQVLDIIRDFDLSDGLNIRLLNWFGHGLFLFVLLGKNHPIAPFQKLSEYDWAFDRTLTPWEYPEILLKGSSTKSPPSNWSEKSTFCQWHKSIPISGNTATIKKEILDELKKLIFLLS
ncbi:hypothetical protein J2X69_003453 [Algoriphagus sp. 4150]|uniref:hypothetical protein n=1 Tax=Algoriphagus sp. 4150 TaxID=2817756 RepID=UPI002858F351|nr:hypothetical protein [Algoriphagus sp. 4150]MDR7131094.1 hypothetical protein [Algoriphagus sp. 4150]